MLCMNPAPQDHSPEEPVLTKAQKSARQRFETLITDSARADMMYDMLPETKGGGIVSTDLTRFLDASYRIHVPGALRDLKPSWRSAWTYAQGRLMREISHRRGRQYLRLMAGGWASGKTHALQRTPMVELSWDGTLADSVWASKVIRLAVKHGWKVQIAYVHRPIELACLGALERGLSEGRMVPLLKLPRVHANAQLSVVQLHQEFATWTSVDFLLLHNPGTAAQPADVVKLQIGDIAPGGKLHYSAADVKNLEQAACHLWQKARDEKSYPQAILEAAGQGMG